MIIVLLFLASDYAIRDGFEQSCLILVAKISQALNDRPLQKTHNAQIVPFLLFGIGGIVRFFADLAGQTITYYLAFIYSIVNYSNLTFSRRSPIHSLNSYPIRQTVAIPYDACLQEAPLYDPNGLKMRE